MTIQEFNPEGCTGNGNESDMFFNSELSGPDGAHFFLLKEKHHTSEDIEKAKRWIKNNRDCVNIKLINATFQPTRT